MYSRIKVLRLSINRYVPFTVSVKVIDTIILCVYRETIYDGISEIGQTTMCQFVYLSSLDFCDKWYLNGKIYIYIYA